MKTDRYTRVVLTAIAVALVVLALRPQSLRLVSAKDKPSGPKFPGITISGTFPDYSFFDTNTGELWSYHSYGKPDPIRLGPQGKWIRVTVVWNSLGVQPVIWSHRP